MENRASPRLTFRSAIGTLLCAVGVVGVSCSSGGSNCGTGPSSSSTPPQSLDLSSEYYIGSITSVSGAFRPLPARYKDSAGYQLKVWSDTLSLAVANTTYVEHGRVGRFDPATQTELLSNFKSASAKYIVNTADTTKLTFPSFLGGIGSAVRVAAYSKAALRITASIDSSTWYFYPKLP